MQIHQFDTPILLIIFNRPDTTQIVFDQIRKVKPKTLYVFADGPRKNRIGEEKNANLLEKSSNLLIGNVILEKFTMKKISAVKKQLVMQIHGFLRMKNRELFLKMMSFRIIHSLISLLACLSITDIIQK